MPRWEGPRRSAVTILYGCQTSDHGIERPLVDYRLLACLSLDKLLPEIIDRELHVATEGLGSAVGNDRVIDVAILRNELSERLAYRLGRVTSLREHLDQQEQGAQRLSHVVKALLLLRLEDVGDEEIGALKTP